MSPIFGPRLIIDLSIHHPVLFRARSWRGNLILGERTEAQNPDLGVDRSVVEELLRRLEKCLKSITLYSPTHPMYFRAVNELKVGFEPIWGELSSLTLQVRDDGFAWESEIVLPEEHTPNSISWALFSEGIRSLSFSRGVEQEEIVRLLDVIHEARSFDSDSEDDLLTLLWGQYFEHIRYFVVDLNTDGVDDIEEGASTEPPPSADVTQGQVEEEVAELQRTEGLVSFDDFDASLYFLTDGEIDHLKTEIATEFTDNIRVHAVSMFLDILELHRDVRDETCGLLTDLFQHLLAVGDFGASAYLLREVRVLLERATDLTPEHRGALAGFTSKLHDSGVIVQILLSLDDADVLPDAEELGELFAELECDALAIVLLQIPHLTNEAAKRLLRRALRHQAPRCPTVIEEALTSGDPKIILLGLRCVQSCGPPSVLGDLHRLASHKDSAIRRALVDALEVLGTPEVPREIEALLNDPDGEVRVAAVRALSGCGDSLTRSLLESMVLGKAFRGTNKTEKLAFFEAYGALSGEAAVNQLRPLLRRGLFQRRRDRETRVCVVRVLAQIGGPMAETLLQRALEDKDFSVRIAAERELAKIG